MYVNHEYTFYSFEVSYAVKTYFGRFELQISDLKKNHTNVHAIIYSIEVSQISLERKTVIF